MLTYGFYNSVNKDRRYDADQIGAMFDGLINDGVYANYKEALKIVPGSGKREIVIRPGRAWFNGTWILVDGDGHSFYIMGSQVETTYYIYLCVDKNGRRNSIAWYSEAQENKPDEGKSFYLMGQVTIPAGVNTITEDMIVDLRGSSHCPFVTGILETADFEKIVRETCEENWLLWLNSYEAGLDIKMDRIQAIADHAYNSSELALNTIRDLRHLGYTWAKYHAIQVQGGSLAWILAADINDSGGEPPKRILYRGFTSDGANITLSNPVSENAITASEQYQNYRSAPYFNGDGQGGTVAGDVYRYERMTKNVKVTGNSVTVTYGYRISKVKLVGAVYEPGEYIETVHGEYASEYPLDGYKDGYWYTRFAARASEVVFDDDGLTISARTVQEAIAALTKLIGSGSTGDESRAYIEVDSLPDTGISGAIYIVKNPTGGDSDEYIWVDRWEKLGGGPASGENPSQGGLSAAIKTALMAVVESIVVFNVENPKELIDNLRNALYDAPVASISAVYTQTRRVYDSDGLDVLRDDLVVTAVYTDGSSSVRTDYALTGTLSAGTSVITATLDGKTVTFEVTVSAGRIPATGITLSQDTLTFTSKTAVKLSANVVPADSTDIVVWQSSETAVATVTEDGTITPVADGSCVITATAGDVSSECAVTVALPLAGINIGNPFLNKVDDIPANVGTVEEELQGKWYKSQYNTWQAATGINQQYVFLRPFGEGTHYIRTIHRPREAQTRFYAFSNDDIGLNPTTTLGRVGTDYTDATLTELKTFDWVDKDGGNNSGQVNLGSWEYVDNSGNTYTEAWVTVQKIVVPAGVYLYMTITSANMVAQHFPGISEGYPYMNGLYTIFESDPSANILQIVE